MFVFSVSASIPVITLMSSLASQRILTFFTHFPNKSASSGKVWKQCLHFAHRLLLGLCEEKRRKKKDVSAERDPRGLDE